MDVNRDELSSSALTSSIRKLVLKNVFGGEPAVFMLPPDYTPPISVKLNSYLH